MFKRYDQQSRRSVRRNLNSKPLTGRLVRQNKDGETQEYLSYDESVLYSNSYSKVLLDDHLFSLQDGFELTDYLATFNIKKGKYCIDEDEILCQLIIFHDSSMSKLAVMFSLNHCIGDGSTCYSIWDVSVLCSSLTFLRRGAPFLNSYVCPSVSL